MAYLKTNKLNNSYPTKHLLEDKKFDFNPVSAWYCDIPPNVSES